MAGQTAIYGLSSMIGRLLNYLLVPLYTRLFLPGEFGVVTEFYAYVAFLTVIFLYGMETTLFRFSERNSIQSEEEKEVVFGTAFISILASAVCLGSALCLFQNDIAHWLQYPDQPQYITWFAAILFFDALAAMPFARLRLQEKAGKFAALKLLNIGLNISLNLFFLLACPWLIENGESNLLNEFVQSVYSPEVGVGYIFISNLVASGVTFVFLLPEIFKVKLKFEFGIWKNMIRYTWPLAFAAFAYVVNENLDKTLLKFLLPGTLEENLHNLGIYGACYKLSIMMTLFVQAFRYAVEPFFFAQHKQGNAKDAYSKVMTVFVAFGALIFTGIMVFLDIVKYFIHENFHEGLAIVPILLMANLFLGIYFNLSIWYKLTDKTIFGAWFSLSGAGITVVFNFLLIPQIGYMGSAYATLACYSAMIVLSFWFGKKHFPVPYELKKLVGLVILAILFWLFSDWLTQILNWEENNLKFLISGLAVFAQVVVSLNMIGAENFFPRKKMN